MVDTGGLGSVRKCPWGSLADIGDVEGFDRSGEEGQFYAFQLSDGVYKTKKFTPSEGIGSLKFEELSDVDISHAIPRRLHSLAFIGSNGLPLQTPPNKLVGISSPFVVTGKEHKLQKVVNSGTGLCSYIPETKNIAVSEAPDRSYVL